MVLVKNFIIIQNKARNIMKEKNYDIITNYYISEHTLDCILGK